MKMAPSLDDNSTAGNNAVFATSSSSSSGARTNTNIMSPTSAGNHGTFTSSGLKQFFVSAAAAPGKITLKDAESVLFIASCTTAAVTALYTTYKTISKVREWKQKDTRLRKLSNLPILPIPATDNVLFGTVQDMTRNWDRFLDWRLDGFKSLNAMTICRPAPVWVPNPFIHTCDPVVVKHILKDEFNKYIKNSSGTSRILQDLLGDGIFGIDHGPHAPDQGASWIMQRKVASNIFTKSTFRGFMSDVFRRHAITLGQVMDEALEQTSILDMQSYMFRTTLDVIGEVGFGYHLDTLTKKEAQPFAVAFDRAQVLLARRPLLPFWNIPILNKILYPSERELAGHIRTLNKFAYEVIARRKMEREEALHKESDSATDRPQDILSLFLAEKLNLPDVMLRDVVMSFMIAGRDTTACTLSFALLLFAQNPEKQELAREEVNRILGAHKTCVATLEQVGEMKYLCGCVQESLRLYPPVPVDSKVCAEEDVLPNGGRVFPGQRISFEPYCMGRLSPLWKDDEPYKFKPERWVKMDKLPSAYEFPVFQAGPRVCLGQSFAMLESQVVLSFLLHSGYRFRVLPDREYTYMPGITIAVKDGLPMKVDKI